MSAVTPGEARGLAKSLDRRQIPSKEDQHSAAIALRHFADQIEALTADLAAEKLFSKQAMDSVTEIAAQRDALKAEVLLKAEYCRTTSNAHEAACAQRDALTIDANRYRFMRDEFAKESSDAAGAFAALEPMTGLDFDAAIDAAMGEVK